MKKSSWFLIVAGLIIGLLLICGGLVGLIMWISQDFGAESGRLGFGEGVGLVRVEGIILPGEAPPPNPFAPADNSVAYSQTVIDHLKQANEDSDAKIVVMFVDSPGGSVYASDEIYLQLLAMDKPVIVSMGSLAASGGYYISAPAQEIWASPHTLTCSIGVISQFLNLDKFGEEYGISTITVKSGKFKDTGNPFKEFTEDDRALWQSIVDEAYNEFVRIVVEGRQMDEAEVRRVADGRVCTGKQAQEYGLIDELGYLPDVIDHAANQAGIEGDPRIIEYDEQPSIWGLSAQMSSSPSPVMEMKQLLHYHPGSPLMYLYVGP